MVYLSIYYEYAYLDAVVSLVDLCSLNTFSMTVAIKEIHWWKLRHLGTGGPDSPICQPTQHELQSCFANLELISGEWASIFPSCHGSTITTWSCRNFHMAEAHPLACTPLPTRCLNIEWCASPLTDSSWIFSPITTFGWALQLVNIIRIHQGLPSSIHPSCTWAPRDRSTSPHGWITDSPRKVRRCWCVAPSWSSLRPSFRSSWSALRVPAVASRPGEGAAGWICPFRFGICAEWNSIWLYK